MLDCIFIDLDGPILDGKYRHYHCYRDIIKLFGGDIIEMDIYWDMKRSKISRETILKRSNFRGSYSDFYTAWIKSIEKRKYLKLDTLKPKVYETLKKWRNLTNSIILITMRQDRKALVEQLKDFEIYNCFDEIIVCPPERKNTKYESVKNKIFNYAIFIGDTEEDINTAKMLNIKSIGITNGIRKQEFLDADYFYEEIKDIIFSKLDTK